MTRIAVALLLSMACSPLAGCTLLVNLDDYEPGNLGSVFGSVDEARDALEGEWTGSCIEVSENADTVAELTLTLMEDGALVYSRDEYSEADCSRGDATPRWSEDLVGTLTALEALDDVDQYGPNAYEAKFELTGAVLTINDAEDVDDARIQHLYGKSDWVAGQSVELFAESDKDPDVDIGAYDADAEYRVLVVFKSKQRARMGTPVADDTGFVLDGEFTRTP